MHRFALLVASLVLLFTASSAAAATRTVPGQHPTFAAAYNASQPGDVIQVADGTYPRQDVPSGSKAVTFRGGPGVRVRQLFTSAANATFDGINVDAGGSKTVGGAAFEPGAANMTFKNAYVGNVTDEKGMLAGSGCVGCVFDNVHFRDVRIATDGVHNECVYSQAANITIKNSRFTNCATMDVFFTRGTWWGQAFYGGFTLTNNFFGKTFKLGGAVHYYSVVWGLVGGDSDASNRIDRATIRGNTFELPVSAVGTFTNSVESCNTPPVNEPGLVHEPCGTPTPTPSPSPTPTPAPDYDPACRPDCDQIIEQLRDQIARILAIVQE